jgi:hypothetical protein
MTYLQLQAIIKDMALTYDHKHDHSMGSHELHHILVLDCKLK